MDAQRRLEEIFGNFPGIGPRQARRFVYHILSRSPAYLNDFVRLIQEVKEATAECGLCHRFYVSKKTGSQSKICNICSDPNRDTGILMVVSRDSDLESVEKSDVYKGMYFVLGGSVPILDKEPEKRIRLEKLLQRVSGATFAEVILSMNATAEGEHTGDIVREALKNLNPLLKISVLGKGISKGAELEYLDSDTMRSALENRKNK